MISGSSDLSLTHGDWPKPSIQLPTERCVVLRLWSQRFGARFPGVQGETVCSLSRELASHPSQHTRSKTCFNPALDVTEEPLRLSKGSETGTQTGRTKIVTEFPGDAKHQLLRRPRENPAKDNGHSPITGEEDRGARMTRS